MDSTFHTRSSLSEDLSALDIREGDGIFVHASMKAIGTVVGGPRTVVETLMGAVGETGLVGMPGFSSDAYFPSNIDRSALNPDQITQIESAVPGFDKFRSPTSSMGVIAETFRTWPGTRRSNHPAVSICLNGLKSNEFLDDHSLAWATGSRTPLGKLQGFQPMKILLIGVGWNRCSALHTAETLAEKKRTKVRRFKSEGSWVETPDVADDLNRLFPRVGDDFERAGFVSHGPFGEADCTVCNYRQLIEFASDWIDSANRRSGDVV